MAPAKNTRSNRASTHPANGSPTNIPTANNPPTNNVVSEPMTNANNSPFASPTQTTHPISNQEGVPITNFEIPEAWETDFQGNDPEISALLGENTYEKENKNEESEEEESEDEESKDEESKEEESEEEESEEDSEDDPAEDPEEDSEEDPEEDLKETSKADLRKLEKKVNKDLKNVKCDVSRIDKRIEKMDKYVSGRLDHLVASGTAINQLLVDFHTGNRATPSTPQNQVPPTPGTQIFRDPAQLAKIASKIIDPSTIQPSDQSMHDLTNSTNTTPSANRTQSVPPNKVDQDQESTKQTQAKPSPHKGRSMSFQGQTYVSSPIIYKAGDMVFWKHHSGLLVQVQINQVYICNPIEYDIMLLTDGTTTKAEHSDLFVLDDPTKLDVKSPTTSNVKIPPVPLTAVQVLALTAFPDNCPQDIATWDNMDSAKFKLGSFVKLLAGLVIADNSIMAIDDFYMNLTTCFESCHMHGASILPALKTLTPADSITSKILPPTEYQYYSRAYAFMISVGRVLKELMEREITTRLAPNARRGVFAVVDSEATGWDILTSILKTTIPHLGALGIFPQQMIDELKLQNGDDIYQFLQKALKVDKTIRLSQLKPSPNALLAQTINNLCQSSEHRPYLFNIKSKYVEHIRMHTNNIQYEGDTVNTIITYLMAMDAPIHAVIANTSVSTPSTQLLPAATTATDNNFFGQGFLQNLDDENEDDQHFDLRHANINSNYQDQDNETDDDNLRVNSLRPVKSNLRKSSYDNNRSTHQHSNRSQNNDSSNYQGNRKQYQPRPSSPGLICDACGDINKHSTEGCPYRGPNFIEPWKQRRADQYNLVHGDKPKDNIDRNASPKPPTARFSNRSMKTEIDQISQELLTELENGTPADQLSHRALQVNFQGLNPPESRERGSSFDSHQDDPSVPFPIDQDFSDPLSFEDLDIYQSQVNY